MLLPTTPDADCAASGTPHPEVAVAIVVAGVGPRSLLVVPWPARPFPAQAVGDVPQLMSPSDDLLPSARSGLPRPRFGTRELRARD